ncbi:ubiquitin binding protein [Dentipellis sp. KUC8613]|nr:ubiquitin binding protein [Dentipellis sp. KUC8613]
MSTIGTWLWGTSQLDEAVDRATSEMLPSGSEDIALNLEICDQIRSKSVQPKDAIRALKRRLNHKNPNVQLLTLGLTDICIKNGGDHFLVEVASRDFMDNYVSLLKLPGLNRDVKDKMLRYIQGWAIAFKGKPTLSYVGQVYKTLKTEGFTFPPEDLSVVNTVMVDTQTAPEWIDSDVCLRCRTPFSFTNRKHHCRNCGQVFDQQCSAKSLPLPHFGITQEVRVCDSCHTKLTRNKDKSLDPDGRRHRSSHSVPSARHRAAREAADAELQRAIQLSLEEVNGRQHGRSGYVPYQPDPNDWKASEPPIVDHSSRPATQDEEDDPDLKAAIEASLREANAPKPSAPIGIETPRIEQGPPFGYSGTGYSQSYPPAAISSQPAAPALPNYDLEPLEADTILTFSQTVEQLQSQGGRDMSRYPAVGQLYDKANGLRPKLAMNLDDTGRKEEMLTEMHEKLSQAVKLYDNLLTQQLSRPTWRSVPRAASQQTESPYSQWNSAQQLPIPTDIASALPQASSSYAPPPSQAYQNPASAEAVHVPQAAQQSWPQYQEAATAGPYESQQSYSSSVQSPSQYSHYQTASVPPPMTPSSQTTLAPVSIPQSPPPQAAVQYSHAIQSPVLVPSQVPSSPPTRHNTIPSYGIASLPPSIPTTLARQNTVSASTQAAQFAPPASVALPSFPSVPTSLPQQYPVYTNGFPPGVEHTEKKEALLIDL